MPKSPKKYEKGVHISSLQPGDYVRSWGDEDVLVLDVQHEPNHTGLIQIRHRNEERILFYNKDFSDLQRLKE